MQCTLSILLSLKSGGIGHTVTRMIDLPFTPSYDIALYLPEFEESRLPKRIEYDIEDECFRVFFDEIKCDAENERALMMKMYEASGWSANG